MSQTYTVTLSRDDIDVILDRVNDWDIERKLNAAIKAQSKKTPEERSC